MVKELVTITEVGAKILGERDKRLQITDCRLADCKLTD